MQYLVSPERLLFRVADADALKALVLERMPDPSPDEYEANIFALERARLLEKRKHLIHNLNALCGFGNKQPRDKMHQIDDWQLLEKVTWLYKKGSTELVPLVGRPEHRFDSVLRPREDVSFQVSSLIKLAPARGGKPKLEHVGLWKVADPPLDLAMQLDDGACLTDVNLLRCAPLCAQVRSALCPLTHARTVAHAMRMRSRPARGTAAFEIACSYPPPTYCRWVLRVGSFHPL